MRSSPAEGRTASTSSGSTIQRFFHGALEGGAIEALNEYAPDFVERFRRRVGYIWPGDLRYLNPFPGFTEADIRTDEGSRLYPDLLICAAELHSYDLLPWADEDNYYSFARVMWIQDAEEPMLPESVLRLIDWEVIAKSGG